MRLRSLRVLLAALATASLCTWCYFLACGPELGNGSLRVVKPIRPGTNQLNARRSASPADLVSMAVTSERARMGTLKVTKTPTARQEAEPCARLADIWGSVKCSRWVKVRDQLYFAG